MRLFYTSAIACYAAAVRLAAPFNEKASALSRGWKHWHRRFPAEKLAGCKTAWFHASSLGEFEQARPVMESFRASHPDYKICLSFFSPSGFEIRKDYPGADVVCYLPPDTRRNARRWMQLVHPDISFFVKYDFWFNYLQALKQNNIPTFIFSAIFRPSQYFFRWYGGWFARQLHCYSHLFVQNETSLQLLHSIGINHCSIAGDTRFDRVNDIARQAQPIPVVERFVESGRSNSDAPGRVLIAGSSWEPDEANIRQFLDNYNKPLKVILAPHMIGKEHLASIERLFEDYGCVRYSQLAAADNNSELFGRQVLIIDNIGMLSAIYRYATVAYIGGGFGKGIHNILEAAVYSCPVCFGPNYHKFQEACQLIELQGAKSYSEPAQLTAILSQWFDDDNARLAAATACHDYMHHNLGATQTIIAKVENV